MAVATGTLQRRQNQEKKVAAKSKRDKIILAVGGLVLVAVLAFELPSILKGSSSSAPPVPATPAPTAAVSSTAVQTGTSSVAVVRRELAAIAKLPSKDPFQAQLGTGDAGSSTQLPSLAKEPRVRTSHFVVKNPFKVLIGAPVITATVAPLAKAPVVTPAKVASKASTQVTTLVGYIVVLRSLDSAATARQEVRRAHAQGLVSAAILYSSRYSTLRHGYWVVYLNRYPTMAAANAGLQEARAHGYASAYRRPVRKVTNR
jgi:hypothetical protein